MCSQLHQCFAFALAQLPLTRCALKLDVAALTLNLIRSILTVREMQAERFLLNKKSLHTLTLYSFKNIMVSDAEQVPGCLPQDPAFCSYAHQSYNFVLQDKVTESHCKLNHVTTQS